MVKNNNPLSDRFQRNERTPDFMMRITQTMIGSQMMTSKSQKTQIDKMFDLREEE